jgi:hypothetical protein
LQIDDFGQIELFFDAFLARLTVAAASDALPTVCTGEEFGTG